MKTSIAQLAIAAFCLLLSTGAIAQKDTLKYRTPTSYDSVSFRSANVLLAWREGKLGVLTSDGRLALPFVYDGSEPAFSNGYLKVYKNGMEGIINDQGQLIVEPIYQYVSTAAKDFFVIKLNDKYGTIDLRGKQVIPADYSRELVFSDGLAAVELNGKYGYINPKGELIIPYQYDRVADFRNGRAMVTLNGESYEIDRQNKRIVPEVAPKTVKEAKAKDARRKGN
jgi:hypothetical protein